MTKTNMDLSELLSKHDQGDFLRTIAEAVLQLIMETDVEGLIGAGRHERSGERTTWRNGHAATTDTCSRHIRTSRRCGHITARARSPRLLLGLPALTCSRCPESRMHSG